MQTDSDIPGLPPDAPATTRPLRRVAWLVAALLAAGVIAALLWTARSVETSRALASVERSVAAVGRPAPVPAAPAPAPEAVPAVAPPAGDRLPPLSLGQAPQRAPDAVLRDLPEWLVAEVGGGVTSGASGAESAARAEKPRRRVERPAAIPRTDRYGSEFARCPGPGESGAVECRRAVCSGGARKAAACAPYRDQ